MGRSGDVAESVLQEILSAAFDLLIYSEVIKSTGINEKNSIKESIDAMCKSLGFKKDRRSGHYMREVTPGLEDAIHFFL